MFIKIIEKISNFNRLNKVFIQMFSDLILINLCFLLSMFLRLDNFNFINSFETIILVSLMSPISVFIFYKLKFYNSIIRFISNKILIYFFVGAGISSFLIFFYSYIFNLFLPRSVPFINFLLLFLLISFSRLIVSHLFHLVNLNNLKNVAIYGCGSSGRELFHTLMRNIKFKPVLFIDDNIKLKNALIGGISVKPFDEFLKIYKKLNISTVLLAMPKLEKNKKIKIIENLERYSLQVKTIPNFSEIIQGKKEIQNLKNISIEELIGRNIVPPIEKLMKKNTTCKNILISGAGGSIGQELCEQILKYNPERIILFDISEYNLFMINKKLLENKKVHNYGCEIIPVLGSILNKALLNKVLKKFNVNTIYHAAAYKHVPLVEQNVTEAIKNNVFGTKIILNESLNNKVKNFILISSDKAVRPSNFMGVTKRISEIICLANAKNQNHCKISIVRFGNVLGSSGSVIPQFEEKIKNKTPITVTHKKITRYFMTIEEAAQLVVQAGAMGKSGDLFILKMGSPIKIIDIAKRMLRLNGYIPEVNNDISKIKNDNKYPIHITGLRPGEKLFEEILISNKKLSTVHPKIIKTIENDILLKDITIFLNQLNDYLKKNNIKKIKEMFSQPPIYYNSDYEIDDVIWSK